MASKGYINTDTMEVKSVAAAKGSFVLAPDGGIAMSVRGRGDKFWLLRLAGKGSIGQMDPVLDANMGILTLGAPWWSVECHPPVVMSADSLGVGSLVFTDEGQFLVAVNPVSLEKMLVRFQNGDVFQVASGAAYLVSTIWKARCMREDDVVVSFIFDGRPDSLIAMID